MSEEDTTAIWAKLQKVEERLQATEMKMTEQLTKISTQMETLVTLAQTYVTKERFQMVQIIVYGFTGIILTSVIGAMLAKVIMK